MQNWLADFATGYLSKELKTKVHVDKVRIRFMKSVELKGVYIEDLHHDTLLYAASLTVDIKVEKESFKFYAPLVSMLLVSIVLSLAIWLVRKFWQ